MIRYYVSQAGIGSLVFVLCVVSASVIIKSNGQCRLCLSTERVLPIRYGSVCAFLPSGIFYSCFRAMF